MRKNGGNLARRTEVVSVMGIIAEDHHDVFFSYATIDNRLHDNWIKDFRDDLKTRVLIEMNANVQGFKDLDLDQIDFFID